MKNLLIIIISFLTVVSCSSTKKLSDPETLPKDISFKPENNVSQIEDRENLKQLIGEIDSLISTEVCTDPTEWTFTAIGAKPCGGPSSYLAYPKKLAEEILPKVTQFTAMQDAINKKYHLMSDCAVVLPPSEIICENGKAVLTGGRLDKKEEVE